MTETQFDRRLQEIEEGRADRKEKAAAWGDQEMARLFLECEWTQEKIAQRVGKKKSWVSYRLRFGAFLKFSTACGNSQKPPENLTEGRFRSLWVKTKGKEPERFEQVLQLLQAQTSLPGYRNMVSKPGVAALVRDFLMDGAWRTIKNIHAALVEQNPDIDKTTVSGAIRYLSQHPPRGYVLESTHTGRLHRYRLRQGLAVAIEPKDLHRLVEGVTPIIEELKQWGHAHEFAMSPVAIRLLAAKLEKLFAPLRSPVPS